MGGRSTPERQAEPEEHWQLFTCSCCGHDFLTRLQARVNLCERCAPVIRDKAGKPARLRHSSLCALHLMGRLA